MRNLFRKMTPVRIIALGFALTVLIGATAPFAVQRASGRVSFPD